MAVLDVLDGPVEKNLVGLHGVFGDGVSYFLALKPQEVARPGH